MCLDMFVAQLMVKRPLLLCGRYHAQRDLYRSNNTYQKLLTSRFITQWCGPAASVDERNSLYHTQTHSITVNIMCLDNFIIKRINKF